MYSLSERSNKDEMKTPKLNDLQKTHPGSNKVSTCQSGQQYRKYSGWRKKRKSNKCFKIKIQL